jgi:hypothetical protein
MSGDEPGVVGITQRDLLLEMREDIRGLKATVDAIARDQALGVERRQSMQRSADSIYARLDGQDRDLDRMLAWQNRADGALVLARWALGASLVSLVAVVLRVVSAVAKAVNPPMPWPEAPRDRTAPGSGTYRGPSGCGTSRTTRPSMPAKSPGLHV